VALTLEIPPRSMFAPTGVTKAPPTRSTAPNSPSFLVMGELSFLLRRSYPEHRYRARRVPIRGPTQTPDAIDTSRGRWGRTGAIVCSIAESAVHCLGSARPSSRCELRCALCELSGSVRNFTLGPELPTCGPGL
jgi:hypothetical protein